MERINKEGFFDFPVQDYQSNSRMVIKKINAIKDHVTKYIKELSPSDGELALEVIRVSSWFDLPPPKWAVDKIANCWSLYSMGFEQNQIGKPDIEIGLSFLNLQEAFEIREELPKSRFSQMKKQFYAPLIYELAMFHKAHGHPCDDSIWQKVMNDHKVIGEALGEGTVKQIYYWYVKEAKVATLGKIKIQHIRGREIISTEKIKPSRKNYTPPMFTQMAKIKSELHPKKKQRIRVKLKVASNGSSDLNVESGTEKINELIDDR